MYLREELVSIKASQEQSNKETRAKIVSLNSLLEKTKSDLRNSLKSKTSLANDFKRLDSQRIETAGKIDSLQKSLDEKNKELSDAKFIATCALMRLEDLTNGLTD